MEKSKKHAISCVILSGGRSSRMGSNKALLPFGGFETLAEYQYTRLSKIFENVYISCKNERLFGFRARFIREDSAIFAPSFGIKQAFDTLQEDEIFFITIDAPFLARESIDSLIETAKNSPDSHAVLIENGGKKHHLIGIYRACILPRLRKLLHESNYKVSSIFNSSHVIYKTSNNINECYNLNTKEEYEYARFLEESRLISLAKGDLSKSD